MKAVYRWTFYILGMLVLALGLTLNTKAGLGVSPIISIAFAVSEICSGEKTAGSPTCSSCP